MEKNTINLRLADLRKSKHITQSELAEKVGTSFQTISKWENDLMICGNREKIKTNNNFDNQDLHNKRVYAYYEKITEKNVA